MPQAMEPRPALPIDNTTAGLVDGGLWKACRDFDHFQRQARLRQAQIQGLALNLLFRGRATPNQLEILEHPSCPPPGLERHGQWSFLRGKASTHPGTGVDDFAPLSKSLGQAVAC